MTTNTNILKLDKIQLCELLGTKEGGLKTIIKRKQLETKLNNIGYNLIETTKEGKKNIYIIEQQNINKQIYNNTCKFLYKTNNEEAFTKYFLTRTNYINEEQKIYSKKDIGNISKVCTNTISKWDKTLLNTKIISNDGYFYFYIDMINYKIAQCTQEEYKTFWRNKAYLKAFQSLQNKYIKSEITLNELQLASAEIGATIALTENKYYYRTKKYNTNTENQLYIDTIELIKNIYGTNENIELFELVK